MIVAGVIVLLLVSGLFLLSYYGVRFVSNELQRRMGPGATVSEVKIRLTHLYAGGIRYENTQLDRNLIQIDEVRIYPSLLSILTRELRIRELVIVHPSVYILRSRDGSFFGPWPGHDEKKDRTANEAGQGKAFQMKIDKLRIEKAAIDFEDRSVEGPPAAIYFKQLDVDIKDIQYPSASVRSQITVKGKMEGSKPGGEIETTGWMDFNNLDMGMLLKVTHTDVRGFEPYYRKRVSAEIESGYMDLQAKINVKNKMIDAPGELELSQFRIRETRGSVLWIPATTLVSVLRDKGNRIKVGFHVKGNIDDPRFSVQENIMRRLAISLAESLGVPIKIVGEGVLKGTLKGAEGLAESLKSLQELFRPSKEKK